MIRLENKIRYLSKSFYNDYRCCTEILTKQSRPYSVLIMKCEDLTFAIPFRTSISHPYSYILSEKNLSGLDFTKAVIINNMSYLAEEAIVNDSEYRNLVRSRHRIISRFKRFIKDYKRWVCNPQKYNKESLCSWTSLQYFHKELGIE